MVLQFFKAWTHWTSTIYYMMKLACLQYDWQCTTMMLWTNKWINVVYEAIYMKYCIQSLTQPLKRKSYQSFGCNIGDFYNEYSPLSNFYSSFTLGGVRYYHGEQYYNATKAESAQKYEFLEQVLKEKSSYQCQAIARKLCYNHFNYCWDFFLTNI